MGNSKSVTKSTTIRPTDTTSANTNLTSMSKLFGAQFQLNDIESPATVAGNSGAGSISQKGQSMSRTASGTEIGEKSISMATQWAPIEKLAKILQYKTHAKYSGINGIISDVFIINVFPNYPELGNRLFNYLHIASKAQTKHISAMAFRQQCERFVGLLDDGKILENYVKMFSNDWQQQPSMDLITVDNFRTLLMTCFTMAMAHYTDGAHKHCPLIHRTLTSVTLACFLTKDVLTIGYVCRWLEQNCPRLVLPVHRFVLHTLSTAYRVITSENMVNDLQSTLPSTSLSIISSAIPPKCDDNVQLSTTTTAAGIGGLEMATPILDNANPFDAAHPPLMPISVAWLLAGTLPPLYTKPQQYQNQVANSNTNSSGAIIGGGVGGSSSNNGKNSLAMSTIFLQKILSIVPSHWTLLYASDQHGCGSNRFLHHVLGYRGPTLCMFRAANEQVFCVASATEWRETHVYTGTKDCCLIQILPKFSLVETGPKLLYLNTSMRGYAKGLKVGSDPRRPLLSVDEHFEKIDCRGISSELQLIEVWGCGDKVSRDIQLDIKKWQVKEAERQRTVKLTTADWLDNPDRYLLELGGRPQYNN